MVEEYLHYRMDKEFCNDIACGHMNKESAIQYAHEFYTYALDLQSEVKRLRDGIRSILSDYDIIDLIREVDEEDWNFEQQALVRMKEMIE